MGREEFSAPEKSTREKRRKSTVQVQYAILGAFLGALLATAGLSTAILGVVAVVLGALPFLTNKYWDEIHSRLPQ